MTDLDKILRDPMSRREFLTRLSATGLGVGAVGLLAGCGGGGNGFGGNSNGTSDPFGGLIPANSNINTRTVTYALALETTEADLYRLALNMAAGLPTATPLNPNGYQAYFTNGAGVYPGTNKGSQFNQTQANIGFLYLAQYAYVEAAHRDTLLTTLGHTPDNRSLPTTANTTNPVVNPAGYHFTPTNTSGTATPSLFDLLNLMAIVEETGVTAYLGAVPLLTDLPTTQIASVIYSTEARHSAGLDYILAATGAGVDTSGAIGPNNPTGAKVVATATVPQEFEFAQTPVNVLTGVKKLFYN